MKDQVWALTGDYHVGSPTGLTIDPQNAIQRNLLKVYRSDIEWAGPIDVVVLNGDAIDGADKKGHDTTQPNMLKQAEDAAILLAEWNAKDEYIIATGTRYHVDVDGMNFEDHLVTNLKLILLERGDTAKVTLTRKLKTTINKWFLLEGRHKIGGSGIPHGRKTSMERSKFWNILNAGLASKQKNKPVTWPDLIFFSHIHYYGLADDFFGTSLTLPCYQAIGSRYGDEECDGHVCLGCCRLTVRETREAGWLVEKRLHLAGLVDRLEHR